MGRIIYLLIILLISFNSFAQKVNPKSATITFQPTNSLTIDGLLFFEIDVRMSDCLSNIEIIDIDKMKIKKNLWDKIYDWWWFKVRRRFDFQFSKRYSRDLHEENYFLREDESSEQIYMKCELISLQSVFGRKNLNKNLEINLYSKSGRKVYTKKFKLNKIKLVEESEVRLGVEPS